MSTSNYRKLDCPVAEALSIIGDQWTLLIIRDALMGLGSFTEFHQSLGLSRRLLSRRLREMVDHDLLRREPIRPGASRMKYVPTAKARELGVLIASLISWGERWYPGEDGARYRLTHAGSGAAVEAGYVRADTNQGIAARELAIQPGPGADGTVLAKLARMHSQTSAG